MQKSNKSTQKTIKIDEYLWDELDKWLGTEQAKKKGFHSKAQFATEAIREYLYMERNDQKPIQELTKRSKEVLEYFESIREELIEKNKQQKIMKTENAIKTKQKKKQN